MKTVNWDNFEIELNKNNQQVDYTFFESRVEIMQSMISKDVTSVMDLGAGNMTLKKYLSPNIQYYPVDYCKKYEDTIVSNFNNYEFPKEKADAVFISGLLEYIKDYKWLIEKICEMNPKEIIISYNVVIENLGQVRTFETADLFCNYENTLTFSEILHLFEIHGYVLMELKYLNENMYQPLMKFEPKGLDKIGNFYMCNGCAACQNVCVSAAIHMKADLVHGYRPIINFENCVKCNKCVEVCSGMNTSYNNDKNPDIYALWANETIRKKSSSGGAFTIFANTIIKWNGRVYGAAWDEKFGVSHIAIENTKELDKLRVSKYVQSNTSYIYQMVEKDLQENRYVLFAGTPCQVAGLKNFVSNPKNLFTIDLLCMGTPSSIVFEKYLSENYEIDDIKEINFRDKSIPWNFHIRSMKTRKNGTKLCDENNDMYQKGFYSQLFVRPVCEVCQFATYPRQGDITIGDFWGIEKSDISWNDGNGTSMVMVNSIKGKELFDMSKEEIYRIQRVEKEWTKYAARINDFVKVNKNRDTFNKYVSHTSFNNAVEKVIFDKWDIGIVVCFNYNYGNNLTNYALYQYLKDKHYLVKVIDMPQKNMDKDRKLKMFLKNPYESNDLFIDFKEKENLIALNDKCDTFILGSDQLLRDAFVLDSDFYTCMDWVHSDKYKVTYATSFGQDFFEGNEKMKAKMRMLLKRIQHISLREASGIKLLKDEFGLDAVSVVDPVFLCDKHHYLSLIENGKQYVPKDKFIGAYLLDLSEESEHIVLQSAKNLTMGNHVVISDSMKQNIETVTGKLNILSQAKVEEWLALIKECDFFITDSFHGICFALIFQKQFCVVTDYGCWRGWSRIKNILQMVGLEDRTVTGKQEFFEKRIWEKQINYEKVNKLLQREISRSKLWLENVLLQRANFKGEYTSYDMYLEQNIFLKQQEKELKLVRNDIFSMRMNIRKNIKFKMCDGGKMTIVAFGAGENLSRNLYKIQEIYNLKYVCDNDSLKWGKEIYKNVFCISPSQLKEMEDVLVLICVDNVQVAFEIVDQLLNMGICTFEYIDNWLKYVDGEKV